MATPKEKRPVNKTILVVDDDAGNRELLVRRLTRDGYKMLEAADGPAALEMLEQGVAVNLVLLDIMMPGMDGLAVLERLRESWNASELPVIVVTALGMSSSVIDALHAGANDYVTKPIEFSILKARVANHLTLQEATAEIRRMNVLLEGELATRNAEFERIATAVEHAAEAIAIYEVDGTVLYVNNAYTEQTGLKLESFGDKPSWELYTSDRLFEIQAAASRGEVWSGQLRMTMHDGRQLEAEGSISPVVDQTGCVTHFVSVMRDVTERNLLISQLAQAQKLESIGQLAAGIAHEINTPTQYVGDNNRFLKEAFEDLASLLNVLSELVEGGGQVPVAVLENTLEEADVVYLKNEIPKALDQSLEGIERVTHIVRAMKDFSHPSQEKSFTDLNAAIESTITVATNEWKYVADLEVDLEDALPAINCVASAVNQVVLNILVNAAHAIAAGIGDSPEKKGRISISTRAVDGFAEIHVADNGIGMSEEVKARIFDPFYTTKEIGKGTGQGLSIAYDVVVNKHSGAIAVESSPGVGSLFKIQLPIHGEV